MATVGYGDKTLGTVSGTTYKVNRSKMSSEQLRSIERQYQRALSEAETVRQQRQMEQSRQEAAERRREMAKTERYEATHERALTAEESRRALKTVPKVSKEKTLEQKQAEGLAEIYSSQARKSNATLATTVYSGKNQKVVIKEPERIQIRSDIEGITSFFVSGQKKGEVYVSPEERGIIGEVRGQQSISYRGEIPRSEVLGFYREQADMRRREEGVAQVLQEASRKQSSINYGLPYIEDYQKQQTRPATLMDIAAEEKGQSIDARLPESWIGVRGFDITGTLKAPPKKTESTYETEGYEFKDGGFRYKGLIEGISWEKPKYKTPAGTKSRFKEVLKDYGNRFNTGDIPFIDVDTTPAQRFIMRAAPVGAAIVAAPATGGGSLVVLGASYLAGDLTYKATKSVGLSMLVGLGAGYGTAKVYPSLRQYVPRVQKTQIGSQTVVGVTVGPKARGIFSVSRQGGELDLKGLFIRQKGSISYPSYAFNLKTELGKIRLGPGYSGVQPLDLDDGLGYAYTTTTERAVSSFRTNALSAAVQKSPKISPSEKQFFKGGLILGGALERGPSKVYRAPDITQTEVFKRPGTQYLVQPIQNLLSTRKENIFYKGSVGDYTQAIPRLLETGGPFDVEPMRDVDLRTIDIAPEVLRKELVNVNPKGIKNIEGEQKVEIYDKQTKEWVDAFDIVGEDITDKKSDYSQGEFRLGLSTYQEPKKFQGMYIQRQSEQIGRRLSTTLSIEKQGEAYVFKTEKYGRGKKDPYRLTELNAPTLISESFSSINPINWVKGLRGMRGLNMMKAARPDGISTPQVDNPDIISGIKSSDINKISKTPINKDMKNGETVKDTVLAFPSKRAYEKYYGIQKKTTSKKTYPYIPVYKTKYNVYPPQNYTEKYPSTYQTKYSVAKVSERYAYTQPNKYTEKYPYQPVGKYIQLYKQDYPKNYKQGYPYNYPQQYTQPYPYNYPYNYPYPYKYPYNTPKPYPQPYITVTTTTTTKPVTTITKAGRDKVEKGYDVYVKRKQRKIGKGNYLTRGYKKANTTPLTEDAAYLLGAETVDRYTNRSFYLKQSNKKASQGVNYGIPNMLKQKFRKKKGNKKIYVEKTTHAIDSPEEKQGIPFESKRLRKMGLIPYKKKGGKDIWKI